MRLIGLEGAAQGSVVEIGPTGLRIGKQPECGLILDDAYASRMHAAIEVGPQGARLVDCGSTNGTFVNDQRVESRILADGDLIRVGRSVLRFQARVEDTATTVTTASRVIQASRVEAQAPPGAADRAVAALAALASERPGERTLEEALEHVMTLALDAVEADRACVVLWREGAQTLQPRLVRCRGAKPGPNLPLSMTLAGRAMQSSTALLVQDAQADPTLQARGSIVGAGVRAAAYVPLLSFRTVSPVLQDRSLAGQANRSASGPVGLLCVDAARPGALTETHLEILTAFAGHAAIAIENAHLVQEKVQAERLAAIGEAVASVAHGLKNIVGAIHTPMQVMEEALESGDQQTARRAWRIMAKGLQRITGLSLNMLAFSREREPVREAADVAALVEEACALVRDTAQERGVTVRAEVAEGVGTAHLDTQAIHRCLLNLLSNALDACEQGGEVTVSARPATEGVEIAIADTGRGIAPDHLPRLFQPFFSTTGSRGTGLGLPVVKKIVEEHGGEVWVESPEGRGATFRLVLPSRPVAIEPEPGG